MKKQQQQKLGKKIEEIKDGKYDYVDVVYKGGIVEHTHAKNPSNKHDRATQRKDAQALFQRQVTHLKHNSRNPELQIYREAFPQVHGNPMEEIK